MNTLLTNQKPVIIGTGLICLDINKNLSSEEYFLTTGGSCINVLLILYELGWHSIPISQMGYDHAAHYILEDLARWEIEKQHILQREDVITPLFIQVETEQGHDFLRECPDCNKAFPKCRFTSHRSAPPLRLAPLGLKARHLHH